MLNKILMPSGGQTTDEMTILSWSKKVGDQVKRGDILFEIETDKAILTVESFAEGKLLDIKYPEGVMVKVGEVVALIGKDGDLEAEKPSGKKTELPAGQPEKKETKKTEAVAEIEQAPAGKVVEKKILASPLAKNLARIENIDLEEVSRSTAGKPIKKADVSRFLEQRRHASPLDEVQEADSYYMEMLPIRKTIARRMKESLSVAPHYVISVDVDMTAAIALRIKLNNKKVKGVAVSFNDIIMQVVAKAIEFSPLVNASFEENRIRVFKNVHIGLAVATETGIVVPVTKNVNKRSLAEIAVANATNIKKVKDNQVKESDLQGGTITISNLGMTGIDRFTAIINQPESCILAIGAISKRPVALGNELAIRDMMNITGSFDHRIIDGAIGAPFLQKIRELMEDPELMLY